MIAHIVTYLLSVTSLFQSSPKSPQYIKIVDKVTANFTKELSREKKIYVSGYGGRMMTDVEEVSLSFDLKRHVSLNDARALFIDIAESYLNQINAKKDLQPFLRNYPFTIHNLSLDLGFFDEKKDFQPDLAHVFYSKRRGVMIYQAHDSKNGLYTIYEEPYEEAVRLVKEGVES